MQKNSATIVGAYSQGNFGDDALAFAAHKCISNVVNEESIYFRRASIELIKSVIPCAKAQATFFVPDFLVYGGGTQFFSFEKTRRLQKFAKIEFLRKIYRGIFSPIRASRYILNILFRKASFRSTKVILLGIGIGPFVQNSLEIQQAKSIVLKAHFVAVRDPVSANYCRQFGRSEFVIGADLCFFPGLWRVSGDLQTNSDIVKPLTIGIIPRDWPHTRKGAAYLAPLTKVVFFLKQKGYRIRFFSFCNSTDTEIISKLAEGGDEIISWDSTSMQIDYFLDLMATVDIFLTARYHGAVFSALLGRPFVAVAVEPKLQIAADQFGRGAKLWEYPYNVEQVLRAVNELEQSYGEARHAILKAVNDHRSAAQNMIRSLSRFLNAN